MEEAADCKNQGMPPASEISPADVLLNVDRSAGLEPVDKRRWTDELADPRDDPAPQQKKSRQQHQHQQHVKEKDQSPQILFDTATIMPSELEIDNIAIGTAFKLLQDEAATVVNDPKKTMTLELVPFFM